MKTVALLISLAMAPAVFGQSDLKAHVSAINAETAAAYKKHDSNFFDQLFSPDFKAKDEHGATLNKKAALFVVRFQLNSIRVTDYTATSKPLKLEKAQGTFVTEAKMVGIAPGRRGGPPSKVVITRKFSDLYQKRGTQWALIYRAELLAPVVKVTPMVLLTPSKTLMKPGH
jgi:hypothetical protein